MTKRIFRSIFSVAALVLLLSFGVVLGLLYHHSYISHWEQMENELTLVRLGMEGDAEGYIRAIAQGDTRITWVDGQGNVLFDTQADAASMDNHAGREEIRQALEQGKGRSQRQSDTLMKTMLYSAVRLGDGTVLRIAAARDSIWALLLDAVLPLCLVFAAAVILSALLARTLAAKIVDPLNSLDLDAPGQNEIYEELSPLLRRMENQRRLIGEQMAQLKEKTEQFTQTVLSMGEGLILLDAKGRILSINPAAVRLFQIDGACLDADIMSVDTGPQVKAGIRDALAGKRSDLQISRNGGEYQISISPIISEELIGAVVLAFDITQQVNSQRDRQEFTANVSHELKTPLQTILSSAQLLQSGLVKPEDTGRFTGYISSEAERLLNLINDVLRLSQLDEKGEFPLEQLDWYQISSQVLQTLLPEADRRKVRIELLGESVTTLGARQLAYEMVYNLCDNAIRYNKEGGTVRVRVEANTLTVEDTGIGIPQEHHARIFERFYRVDKSHSRQTGGTGLGLSIVKHAAEVLGCGISFSSTPGQGTAVTVRLRA